MVIVPYASPIVSGCRSAAFMKTSRKWPQQLSHVLARASTGKFSMLAGQPWVFHMPERALRPLDWRPKLYVCVGARSYWPTVLRLIHCEALRRTHWKFFDGPTGYERPDKIVVFADSPLQLRRLIKEIRPLLPATGLHSMRHAAPAAAYGFEKDGLRGL